MLSDFGLNTWVSIEPYPVPTLDEKSTDIEKLLEKVAFVKKIVFGKLNYRKLTMCETYPQWKNNDDFYKMTSTLIYKLK